MKKLPIIALLFLSSCFLVQNEGEKPLLKVGESFYTLGSFKNYLEYQPIPSHIALDDQLLNKKAQELAQMELLIQKAKAMGLDKDPGIQRRMQRILIDSLIQQEVEIPVRSQKITNQEIKDYFDSHHLQFNRPPEINIVEIYTLDKEKIDKAFKEVKAGKNNFVVLSKIFSDKHPNYPKGRPGYFDPHGEPAGLPENLVKAAFNLEMGELSPVIESEDGYRIIKVVGKRPAVKANWQDKARQIRQQILQERLEKKKAAFLKDLKENAVVEVDAELIKELTEILKSARTLVSTY